MPACCDCVLEDWLQLSVPSCRQMLNKLDLFSRLCASSFFCSRVRCVPVLVQLTDYFCSVPVLYLFIVCIDAVLIFIFWQFTVWCWLSYGAYWLMQYTCWYPVGNGIVFGWEATDVQLDQPDLLWSTAQGDHLSGKPVNLTAVREMSGILLKIRELSGNRPCQGNVA